MIVVASDPDLSRFLDEAANHRILSQTEERNLLRLAQAGSRTARREIITHNLKFIIRVVKRYRHTGIPFRDLVGEGVLGLNIAITRFNLDQKYTFLTYAVWWVRQAITMAVNNTSRTVRISAEHATPLRRLRQTPLHQTIGGEYVEDVRAIADEHRINPAHLLASLRAAAWSLRFDSPLTEGGPAISEILPSDAPQADEEALSKERLAILARLTRILTPLQRQVITCVYGLGDRPKLTLRDIGIQTNLSHERIRQIKNEAMAKMQRAAGKMRD